MKQKLSFLCLLLVAILHLGSSDKDYKASDIALEVPKPYDYQPNIKYSGVEKESFYLTMRDSVQIAVDLWLPKGLEKDAKIPAILHQTRYWRAPHLRWPFRWFMNELLGAEGEMIETLIKSGYAFINIDARGSGASTGSRNHPWTADEIKDGAEIVDWIIEQSWCDGNVGAAGVSYSGTTAEFLLVNQHPNVKAVVLMFSLFDVYDDNAFPGGVHHSWFTKNWGYANDQLDKNKLPTKSFMAKLLVSGVSYVKGAKERLKQALEEHKVNLNVHDGAKTVQFRDDQPGNNGAENINVFSPHHYIDQINASGAAVYSYSGWLDGAYQHAAIKRHLNLNNPHNKLILGPWEHGGQLNISPHRPGESGFDHIGEILKFFDFHLKGMDTGIDKEPAVHYFTMGEEKWKTADTWPPNNGTQDWYFNTKKELTQEPVGASKDNHFDTYKVDTTTGTGQDTRWRSLMGKLTTPHAYGDRKLKDQKLLYYDSAPLINDVIISGHPLADLYISTEAEDLTLMVYLEDVFPNGEVKYVTEGLLRTIHRQTQENPTHYKDAVPYRTYEKVDADPLEANQVTQLLFDLLPTSYQFKKGHQIRVAIAGADRDHFKIIYKDLPEIKVHHNEQYPSKIELPIIANVNLN